MVIGKLNVLLGLNSSQFNSGMQGAGNKVNTFKSQVSGSTSALTGFTSLATKATLVVGALYAAFGAARPAEAFAQSMASSTAIMGNLSQEMRQGMAQVAKEVATDTKFSAAEAAGAYYYLASAGMDAQQSMAALPQVARFAQAGMFDLATATDLATDAQSALGLVVDDAQQNLANLTRVTDVLVGANTLANASVQQFSEALTNKSGAALRALGKDIEEGVAVLAAFADQGVKGAEAGTQFAIVLRDLQTKAIANAAAFADAGVKVFDAQGEMRNMADILSDLETKLAGLSDKAQKETLLNLGFSDKSVSALQTLLGTSDSIREYQQELQGMSGVTEDVAGKQLPAFTRGWEKIKTLFERLSIVIFTPLLESLGHALLAIAPIIEFTALTLEKTSDAFARFFGGIAEGGRNMFVNLGWMEEGTKNVAEAADKAAPKVDQMGDATERLNEIVEETPDKLASASTAVDNFVASMQQDMDLRGFFGPLRELEQIRLAGKFLDVDPAKYDEALAAAREMTDYLREQEEFTRRTQEHQDAISRGQSLTRSLETPTEQFERRVDEANKLVEMGAVGWNTYTREIAAARNELMKLQQTAKGPALTEVGSQAGAQFKNQWMRALDSIEIPEVPMPNVGGPARQGVREAMPGPVQEPLMTPAQERAFDGEEHFRPFDSDKMREDRMVREIERMNKTLEEMNREQKNTTNAATRTAQAAEEIEIPETVEM